MSDAWEQPPARSPLWRAAAVTAAAIVLGGLVTVMITSGAAPDDQLAIDPEPSTPTAESVVDPPADVVRPWPRPRPGVWRRLPPAPIRSRIGHTLVWTGWEVLVWGGTDRLGRPVDDGAAFDPAEGSWRLLPEIDPQRTTALAAWTGDEAVFVTATDTLRYDPRADRWTTAAPPPLPDGHRLGDELVVADGTAVTLTVPFAGAGTPGALALPPDADVWRRLPDLPLPLRGPRAVLVEGARVLVFGTAATSGTARGLALDIAATTPQWQTITAPRAVAGRPLRALAGAATDDRLLLWGSRAGGEGFAATNERDGGGWRALDAGPLDGSRNVDGLWIGRRLLVWDRLDNVGAIFNPASGQWTSVPAPPVPAFRPRPSVWFGAGLLVWGGLESNGAVYTPR
jgi:hypothetical protein